MSTSTLFKAPMALINKTPVLGFAAFSGTGKTTLLRRIIPLLKARGLRLGLIKHSHHTFEIDRPGKDSHRLSAAGAAQILVASAQRTVLTVHNPSDKKNDLFAALERVNNDWLDLILVEGFKYYPIPKIELHRPRLGHPLLCRSDSAILAVASDGSLPADVSVPILVLGDLHAIADFIQDYTFRAKG